jgi:hypothetical protein
MSSAEEDSSKKSRISCISVAKVLPFGTGLANPNADNLFWQQLLAAASFVPTLPYRQPLCARGYLPKHAAQWELRLWNPDHWADEIPAEARDYA